MSTTSNADAGKNLLWPGATPLLARVSRQIASGFGGAPGHSVCALQANFPAIPRPQCRTTCPRRSTVITCATPSPTEENGMPLLKPPEPVIAQRRYSMRIEEPLALTMERYAEFLGT